MGWLNRKDERPEGLHWHDGSPSADYPYEQEEVDVQGLHYAAKSRGGSIEVDGDTIHVWVDKSHGKFTNNAGGVEMAKQCLSQYEQL